MKTCLIVLTLALALVMVTSPKMVQDVNADGPADERTAGLSDKERAALADLESSDRFRSIAQQTKQLDGKKAKAYVDYTERRARSFHGLTRLELSNLSELSDEAPKKLAKHRGWLVLNGLTSISDEAAEALSEHHGRLYLNGLKTLSDKASKSLARHGLVPRRDNDRIVDSGGLHLDGLTTLSDAAARALAQQKGELWLRGLTTLSDDAAAELRRKRDIRLPIKFKGEKHEAAEKPSHRTYVYAKIILPTKTPDKGKHPVVESWIAKDLRRRGETKLRAVTDWVRLGEGGENDASIWNATVDGKGWGCPVAGRVADRTAGGKVKVELSGWSPGGAEIKGASLHDEAGSRGIATVDTGRTDEDGRAFVALVVGPVKATHNHARENSTSTATEQADSVFESQKIWNTREAVKSTDIAWYRDQWICVMQTDAGLRIIGSDDGKAWRQLSTVTSSDKVRPLYDPRLSVTSDGRLMLNAVETGIPVGGYSRSWFSYDAVKWKAPVPMAEDHYLVSNVFWHVGVAYNFQRGSSCGNADVRIGVSNDHGQSFQVRYEATDLFGAGKGALVFSQDDGYCVMPRVGKGNKLYGVIGVSKAPFWQWKWKKLPAALKHPNAIRTKSGSMLIAAGLPDGKGTMKTTLCELDPVNLKLVRLETLPTATSCFVGLAKHNDQVFLTYHTVADNGSTVHFARVVIE